MSKVVVNDHNTPSNKTTHLNIDTEADKKVAKE